MEYLEKLHSFFSESTSYQQYVVLGEMLRMYIAKDWHDTIAKTKELKSRQVYYFSMEFLMGRMITNIGFPIHLHPLANDLDVPPDTHF